MRTIKQVLQYAADTLKSVGIETPVLEAGVMLCHVLKCSRTYLFSHGDRLLIDSEFEEMEYLLQKRTENVPLQYLLGETEFMSLSFKVSPAVLIPRQDTEILVEKCIELVKRLGKSDSGERTCEAGNTVTSMDTKASSITDIYSCTDKNKDKANIASPRIRALDMCTGSGCIAVSIAHYCPESRVVACDVSQAALNIAKLNSERAGVQNRLEFRCGDLFEALGSEEKFDIIVSNPPYIESATVKELQRQVRDYEPYLALDGGQDGLEFYRRIAETAPKFMKECGYLVLEIGYNQGESVSKLMEDHFDGITVLKDFGGNDRVVLARLRIN